MSQLKAIRYFILTVSLFLLSSNPPRADIAIPVGITGAWFNPERDGEGFFIEIANVGENRAFVVTWFTYSQGEQMWLVGSAPLHRGDTWVQVPVQRTHGADFGAFFDPNAVERTDWGMLEFSFSSCHAGAVNYHSDEGSGSIDLIRLTFIDELGCEAEIQGGAAGTTISGILIESENFFDSGSECWIRVQLRNTTSQTKAVTLAYDVFDPSGVMIGRWSHARGGIAPHSTVIFEHRWPPHGFQASRSCAGIGWIELNTSLTEVNNT
jgi:hypothetical protein